MSRRTARRHAFVIIFQIEFHREFDLDEAMGYYLEQLQEPVDQDKDFIYTECWGTYQNLPQIDQFISKNLSGWDLDRLNKIDLALARLAIYEMLYAQDIPPSVSINEAVELAKAYGSDESSSFVNGLLGKVTLVIDKQVEKQCDE